MISAQDEKNYKYFFRWARRWARGVLFFMGLFPKVKWEGKPDKNKQYIIVSNHSSEVDIMMNLILLPNSFVFIGKKELAKLPLFGYFYKRTNILVDRKSIASKRNVMDRAARKLHSGVGLCIYPEGGIPDPKIRLAPFKVGAFKLAVDAQVDILPITFADNKRRFPDAWGDGGVPGRLRATVHEVIPVRGKSTEEIEELKEYCYSVIFNELCRYEQEV